MSDTFVCAACHEVFPKGWSDEEARAEYDRLFPEHADAHAELLCDTCWMGFIEWARNEGLVP